MRTLLVLATALALGQARLNFNRPSPHGAKPCTIQEPGKCLWDGAGARNGDIKFRTVDSEKADFKWPNALGDIQSGKYEDMITAVAKMKYGQNLADFLVAHLPKKDGSGTVDYDIQDADVNALNNEDCIDELNGYGEGAVGKVFQHEKIFHFRYMNVTMTDGTDKFELKQLEVVGRIVLDGLDIETCRCEVTGGIGNNFCADLQVKLGVRMRFLECLGEFSKSHCDTIG